MEVDEPTEVLFIGGRSGVGKTTVVLEISHVLATAGVKHALIEGDNLDQAHPAPWQHGIDLAEQNLAAIWRNYRAAGYRRLVFTNTVSVVQKDALTMALGGDVRSVSVLLTASDATARDRLGRREIGSELDQHIARSISAARELCDQADASVHRVRTDERSVADIAAEVIALTGWLRSR